MVELTCVICNGTWEGEIGDIDCPWCEGPEYTKETGGTITFYKVEDITDHIEVLEHDKEDVQSDLEDSQSIVIQEQEKHDRFVESIEFHEIDITQLSKRKENWIEMGIE